jgi:hypothetical protein
MTDQERQETRKVLATATERAAIEASAVALASANDSTGLADLGRFLSSSEGLGRLDNLSNPSEKVFHLSRVFAALEHHPSASSAELCLKLLQAPDFLADDDRKLFLLPALAAVRPMSEAVVAIFRQTNAEGYYNLNSLLLVKNGSVNALSLFEEMIRDTRIDSAQRVDALHAAVLPYRTELIVLEAMNRLVDANIAEQVRIGLIETVFDNRTNEWFGVRKFPPTPPAWQSASTESLKLVLAIADKVKTQPLPLPLPMAVDNTVVHIRQILLARGR